jgi:hypothetical protein
MFITNIYDASNSFNMMLNKNIIDCFQVKQIDQSILTDIIDNYNIEDDENKTKNNKCNFESKNKTSSKLPSKNR